MNRRGLRALLACVLLASAGLAFAAPAVATHDMPEGFTLTRVVGSLGGVIDLEIAPDGRVFVTAQNGAIHVIKDGVRVTPAFATVPVVSGGTQGLQGLALDPDFATNGYVYGLYTTGTSTAPFHRISRWTANGDYAVAGSKVDLFTLDPVRTNAINHNGGDLTFGADGKLYITTGDNLTSTNGQSMTTLHGKLLRLNKDGSIPTDNPYYSTATGRYRSIYAIGLRNPFKLNVEKGSGRMFINDVGDAAWEEVNEVGIGRNYGWPTCEGACSQPGLTDPIFQYHHTTGDPSGCAVTAGAFYTNPVKPFPAAYHGKYFMSDSCADWIKFLDPATGTVSHFTDAGGVIDIEVAPDGSMYWLSRNEGGSIHHLTYARTGHPVITQQPVSRTVESGEPVSFSVMAEGDEPLGYQWQRNGTDISGATSPTYGFTPTSADDGAAFRVIVTNAIGEATSDTATLAVTGGGQPPTATIDGPAEGAEYAAGDTIQFSGSATDLEDGDLPPSAFEWDIVFHHDEHTHPFIDDLIGVDSGEFEVPTAGDTDHNVWYRIHLTVTDSAGKTAHVTREIYPRTSEITIETQPPGLAITIDGKPTASPLIVLGVENLQRTIGVHSPQVVNGQAYAFDSWSDGGAATHNISFPAENTTYVATFVESDEPVGSPPEITDEPDDVAVRIGEAATFSVGATGEDLSYQWRREGVDIAEATGPSYTTPPVTEADELTAYSVEVSNSIGSVASRDAVLTIDRSSPRVTDDLSLLYLFDEGSGSTVRDRSGVGGALDLTIADPSRTTWTPDGLRISSPTRLTSDVATKFIGGAMSSGEFTVEAWVTPASLNPPAAGRIAGVTAHPQRNVGISQGWWNDTADHGTYQGRHRTSSNYNNPIGGGAVATEQTHVVMTRSSGVVTLYVNGTAVSSSSSPGSLVWHENQPFVVGNDTNGAYPFLGTVHLVAAYTRALSSAEVAVNLDAGPGGSGTAVDPPAITDQPDDASVEAGETATFSVAASGASPLSYQWRRAGVAISGATGTSYTTPPLTADDHGVAYSVVVTNPGGSVPSADAIVTVSAPAGTARVNDDLQLLYLFDEGAGTTVHDQAGAGPPLDLVLADPARATWGPDGLELGGTRLQSAIATRPIEAITASGAFTIEAFITPAQANPAEAGRIAGFTKAPQRNAGISQGWWHSGDRSTFEARHRTTAQYNNAMSGGAAVTEVTHVVLTRSAGGTARLYVNGETVSTLAGAGELVWHLDEPFVVGNDTDNRYPFRGTVHLVAVYDDALSATEVATNLLAGPRPGAATADGPTIVRQPADQTVTPGDTATFSVEADGTPPLEYQWYADGGAITGATGPSHTTPPVQGSDDGTVFTVIISNGGGSVTSDPATLRIADDRVTNGLSVLYRFNEGAGTTVRDQSGVGTPLDLEIADPSRTTWLADGLRLDAPTVLASAVAAKLIDGATASGEFTLETWVTLASSTPPSAGRIAGLQKGTQRNMVISQGFWNDQPPHSNFETRHRTSAHYNNPLATGSVGTGRTHVVFTRSADGATRLYLDGALTSAGSSAGSLLWHTDQPFLVGNDPSGAYPFRGTLHLVSAYTRALTAAEVATNFQAG